MKSVIAAVAAGLVLVAGQAAATGVSAARVVDRISPESAVGFGGARGAGKEAKGAKTGFELWPVLMAVGLLGLVASGGSDSSDSE